MGISAGLGQSSFVTSGAAFGVGSVAYAVQSDFGALYSQEVDFVWRCLRRFGIADRDLPDLTHDVFATAWRRFSSFDNTRPLRPWLFGIAQRTALAHRRRSWFRREVLEEPSHEPSTEATSEAVLDAWRTRVLIERALHQLPKREQTVLVLHDFEEIPMAEIALTEEIPVKTAYSRLARARQRFASEARRLEASVPMLWRSHVGL